MFGGQVIGQALVAACRTVEGRSPYSMDAYFLIGGDPKVPIIYEVDRIRDGKSFTTRRVPLIEHGQAIFTRRCRSTTTSRASNIKPRCRRSRRRKTCRAKRRSGRPCCRPCPRPCSAIYKSERPIELRPVEYQRYLGKKIEGGKFKGRIKATGRRPTTR